MTKKLIFIAIILFAVTGVFPQAGAKSNDIVMVLPFENTSGRAEFNWIGESFADSLSDLLRVPTLNVISNEERKIIQQRLRIPLTTLPSLATSLKLARESNATLLIAGRYNIVPADEESAAKITVSARIIKVNEGRFMSEAFPDGSQKIPPIELSDALGNLQTIQGQISYKILFYHDKSSLAFSQNDRVVAATKIPSDAFEAYIKGLLTNDPAARENFFKNALIRYVKAVPDGTYSEAALELGHLYMGQRKFGEAVDAFERVISANQRCRDKALADKKPAQCGDEGFAEASFYIGLIFWQQGNYETALATLRPMTEDLKLTTVYNALGAIAVQASRAEKKNKAKQAALLKEGIDLLKKASESDDTKDGGPRFNYALALFLDGNMTEAATQLRAMIAASPRDGEAYYLLAKTLDSLKDPSAVDMDNQAKRFLTDGNRYAKLETEWQKSQTVGEIALRVQQPARKDFVAVVLSRRPAGNTATPVSETENLLAQARAHIKNGADDEAMAVLRRVLASEPMSAESYLLLGKIHLRRGDMDQAISSFKTSVFWDNRLVDAHVSLGKIYIEKGDCQQAKTYAASAREIDAENQDVVALQRLSERCSK